MPRPKKYRRISFYPDSTYFVPIGIPKCQLSEVILQVEELEAVRLKDVEKLSQEECAEKMNVSRQTFQNIIESARFKITTALIEGKALNISGGHFISNTCRFRCLSCGEIYEINFEQDKHHCPHCHSTEVVCNKKNSACPKWCE